MPLRNLTRRSSRAFILIVAACFLVLVVLGCRVNGLVQDGVEAHDGLCILKDEFQRRIAAYDKYLAGNPDTSPGGTASIVVGLRKSTIETVAALHDVSCPSDPEGG